MLSQDFLLLCAAISFSTAQPQPPATTRDLPPVVFIPGLAGSLLDADVHRKAGMNPLCTTEGKDNLWFNMRFFVPGLLNCWVDEMHLSLDVEASTASHSEKDIEPEGVHVHTKGYGNLKEAFFDYGAYHGGTGIWTPIINQLKMLGYTEADMHAAPYDWRRGPSYWNQNDWPRLRHYIEKVVLEAGGKPAILMSVSQGGPYTAGFLIHGVDADWKRKHIEAWSSYSGVFGGTPGAVALALWGSVLPLSKTKLGYDVKVDYLGGTNVQSLLRGYGGVFMLMPTRQAVGDAPLMKLPPAFHANVTTGELQTVFAQMSPQMGQHYKFIEEYPIVEHPGVKTLCFYGIDQPSPGYYEYSKHPIKPASGSTSEAAGKFLKAAQTIGNGGKPDVMNLVKNAADLSHSLEDAFGDEVPLEAPTAPPGDAKLGSRAWGKAVGRLLERRKPDILHTTPGDGLVPHESLSVCDNWRNKEGFPDVEVHRIAHGSHGSELFHPTALLATRAAVARWVNVPNPTDKSTPGVLTKPNGQKDMEHPLAEFAAFVPPQVAQWTCKQWIGFTSGAAGFDVGASGCNADRLIDSPVDNKLKDALRNDQEFIHRRCPETCTLAGRGSKGQRQNIQVVTKPNGREDMEQPLAEFARFLPPEVATWTCEQWVGITSKGAGYDVGASGCNAERLLGAPVDEKLKDALRKDPEFIHMRCPETCSLAGKADHPRKHAEASARIGERGGKNTGKEDKCNAWIVGVGLKSCWIDVAASACNATKILNSPRCPSWLNESLQKNPEFLHNHCPEYCSNLSSRAKEAHEMPNGTKDMDQPIAEFANELPPQVAQWSCKTWVISLSSTVGFDVGASGCNATKLLGSPKCDVGTRRALQTDPYFIHRRCPETCSPASIWQKKTDNAGAQRLPPVSVLLLSLLFAMMVGCSCLVFWLIHLKRRGKIVESIDVPLNDAGDFSDFEGGADQGDLRSWFLNLFSRRESQSGHTGSALAEATPLAVLPLV
jgi:hypothetical protein